MSVEMDRINIQKNKNNVIHGWFRVKNYNDLIVNYEYTNGTFSFHAEYELKKQMAIFSKWLSNEKELYTTFLLDYFDEINKLNDIATFKGTLIKEKCYEEANNEYSFEIQYDEIPEMINLALVPRTGEIIVFYRVPISINSERKSTPIINIAPILKEETIKRMWDPIRDKTKYRLQLLHMLR